jgi:hypothetical protein
MSMSQHEDTTHLPPLPPSISPLWLGLILPPAAWICQLYVVYAAATHSHSKPVFTTLILVSAVSFLCAALGAVACFRHARDPGRIGFTARLGLLSCALYALTVIAEGVALFMLDSTIF